MFIFFSADEPVEDPSTNEQVNLAEDHPLNTSTTEAEGDQVPERLIFSPPLIRNLPGPSQVVTHHGSSGIDSHGQRQRRRGVSGPPTGSNHIPSSKPYYSNDLSTRHLKNGLLRKLDFYQSSF